MPFEGEHLLPGQLGHLFVIIAMVASLLATIGYMKASFVKDLLQKTQWVRFSRMAFLVQMAMGIGIFIILLHICSNHYFEYLYAYKHSSKELEYKYLLACIWEDQSGSFLLWSLWHSVLGCVLIKKSKDWEAPVMSMVSLAQFFLAVMLLGIYFFGVRIGNNPFALTRNEINVPIFSQPNYLNFIRDGVGLNILLRNYWMVIHPPILFLGFASTIVPFAYAYAGLQGKRYGDWVKPAISWTLFSACVLGVGIMMGGKWAYESLSFGGYWAWDPVENASLVPWLLLVAGLHTMVIYKATGYSLRTSYIFVLLSFVFILYSTFLTRTGILGDTSVHSFTEAGNAMYMLLLVFMGVFTLGSFILLGVKYKQIPAIHKEENIASREFWMFIGSLVIFITAIFIIAKTSLPVVNKIFGSKLAQPEDVEFSYNKIVIFTAIIIGLLTAITQYLKYKSTPAAYYLKKLALPTLLALGITILLAVFYPVQYDKYGVAFLGVIYVALFATIYAAIANTAYIFTVLKGKLKAAGSAVAHLGFTLMLVGMLIASGNKKTISDNRVTGINLRTGVDPVTKQQDNPMENLTLIRQVPTRMGPYEVTYVKDSLGHEKGRKFYQLLFEKKEPGSSAVSERFFLYPDVYLMKDNNMSSNPDTRMYASKDVFTYVTYALNDKGREDTASFRIVEAAIGEKIFYSKGYIQLDTVVGNPANNKFNLRPANGATLMAKITVVGKDSTRRTATPMIQVQTNDVQQVDDTVYAENLYLKFAGVAEGRKIKIGIKESDKLIDYIALKAFIFPYINLVWVGLVIMALGLLLSLVRRLNLAKGYALAVLIVTGLALFYMFLFAN